MTRFRILPVCLVLAAAVLACNLPLGNPRLSQSATITAAIKTVIVQLTSTSMAMTVSAPTGTNTPSPTLTPRGFTGQATTPAPSSDRCNRGEFITDVTIPDGTPIAAGSPFTKTWQLRNTGACTWSTDYSIYFDHGSAMGAPASVPMPQPVAPGETVNISVSLVAPLTLGQQTGYWKLRNPAGVPFGLGSGQDAFYVQIKVTGNGVTATSAPPGSIPTPTLKPKATQTSAPSSSAVYDFAYNYCAAQWQNATALLPCPGGEQDTAGFVIQQSKPMMQDGVQRDKPGLFTHPQFIPNGTVAGIYPEIEVLQGYKFVATLGCQYNAQSCAVRFQLNYRINGGAVQGLQEWNVIYENNPQAVSVDLSSLSGKKVQFLLVVQAMASPAQDAAIWWQPQITR